MIKKTFFASLLILSVIGICLAADLSGKWVGKMTTPDGNEFPLSYNLTVDGEKLTGTVIIPEEELPITEGKVDGENFSFKVTYQGASYLNEGKMLGDSLKVKVHFGEEIVESVLKRHVEE